MKKLEKYKIAPQAKFVKFQGEAFCGNTNNSSIMIKQSPPLA